MNPANLKLVDTSTGEIVEQPDCPHCQIRDDEIAGLQRDLRGWMHRYRELERDKQAEAEKDAMWATCLELFKLWQRETKHPKARWTLDRYEKMSPLVKVFGLDNCKAAIKGIAYEPNTKERKNGTIERFDSIELCFRSAEHVERYARRAPKT